MAKRTEQNPLGAGRKKNEWTSTRRVIPDPLWSKVRSLVEEWKKENKS